MSKDMGLRFRQAAAIDDARVVQLVGNYVIFWREYCRHGTRVRREAGLEYHTRLDILECGNPAFQIEVNAHGAGDRPHRARSRAVFFRGGNGSLDKLGMIGKTEIVVRCEIDHLTAVEPCYGTAGGLQFAEALIRSCLPPCLELIRKISEGI